MRTSRAGIETSHAILVSEHNRANVPGASFGERDPHQLCSGVFGMSRDEPIILEIFAGSEHLPNETAPRRFLLDGTGKVGSSSLAELPDLVELE